MNRTSVSLKYKHTVYTAVHYSVLNGMHSNALTIGSLVKPFPNLTKLPQFQIVCGVTEQNHKSDQQT